MADSKPFNRSAVAQGCDDGKQRKQTNPRKNYKSVSTNQHHTETPPATRSSPTIVPHLISPPPPPPPTPTPPPPPHPRATPPAPPPHCAPHHLPPPTHPTQHSSLFFFLNHPATPNIPPLPLHHAVPT